MPNHYHMILQPLVDGEMSRFMGWLGGTHTKRYHGHYHTRGQGHLYQGRYKSFPIQDDEHFLTVCRYIERNALRAGLVKRAEQWRWGSLWRWLQRPGLDPKLLTPWPIPRSPGWVARVNETLTAQELKAVRRSIERGSPLGDAKWIKSIVRRLHLESTVRPQGRPKTKNTQQAP